MNMPSVAESIPEWVIKRYVDRLILNNFSPKFNLRDIAITGIVDVVGTIEALGGRVKWEEEP